MIVHIHPNEVVGFCHVTTIMPLVDISPTVHDKDHNEKDTPAEERSSLAIEQSRIQEDADDDGP